MIDIKLTCTIALPGSELYDSESCYKTTIDGNGVAHTSLDPDKFEENQMFLDIYDKKLKRKVSKKITFLTRMCKPAYQTTNMSSDAYDEMTSAKVPDRFYIEGVFKTNELKKAWLNMSKEQRLEWHLNRWASDRDGYLVSYHVFDD